LEKIQPGSIDLVLTDPPYDVLDEDHDRLGVKDMDILAKGFYHVLTNNGIALIFCSNLQIGQWYTALAAHGFKLQPTPIYVIHNPSC
jgi:DNA modification methylase